MTPISSAFQISEDDIENVLGAAGRWRRTILPAREARHKAEIQLLRPAALSLGSFPDAAVLSIELYRRLDHNAISLAAVNASDDLDGQTEAAYEEIERQLDQIDPRILTQGYLPPAPVDATSAAPVELPAVIIDMSGGVFVLARSSIPLRIVVLDNDVPGADPKDLLNVNGEEVGVNSVVLTARSDPGKGCVAPDFVRNTLREVDEGITAMVEHRPRPTQS